MVLGYALDGSLEVAPAHVRPCDHEATEAPDAVAAPESAAAVEYDLERVGEELRAETA